MIHSVIRQIFILRLSRGYNMFPGIALVPGAKFLVFWRHFWRCFSGDQRQKSLLIELAYTKDIWKTKGRSPWYLFEFLPGVSMVRALGSLPQKAVSQTSNEVTHWRLTSLKACTMCLLGSCQAWFKQSKITTFCQSNLIKPWKLSEVLRGVPLVIVGEAMVHVFLSCEEISQCAKVKYTLEGCVKHPWSVGKIQGMMFPWKSELRIWMKQLSSQRHVGTSFHLLSRWNWLTFHDFHSNFMHMLKKK